MIPYKYEPITEQYNQQFATPGLYADIAQISFADRLTGLYVRRELADVIHGIKCGEFEESYFRNRILDIRKPNATKEQIQTNKQLLPCFSMARFNGTRSAENTEHSIGIVFDIDHVGTEEDIELCKSELMEIPFVRYAFRSPNDGVKAIVLFDEPISDKDVYSKIFQYCANYILDANGYKVDTACKDICRIHFFSYDPYLLENKLSVPLSIRDVIAMSQEAGLKEQVHDIYNTANNLLHYCKKITDYCSDPSKAIVQQSDRELDLTKAYQIIEHLTSQRVDYEDWIKVGLSLKNVFGDDGNSLWLMFAQNPHYHDTKDSLARKWYSFPANNSCNFGSIVYVGEKYDYSL